jgi:hypothetical protein
VGDFVHLDSFTPVAGDADGWLSTGHGAVIVQPSGNLTIASAGRTRMPAVSLERYCSNLNMISSALGKALLSRLSAPAPAPVAVAGREEWRTPSVPGGCDGR